MTHRGRVPRAAGMTRMYASKHGFNARSRGDEKRGEIA